jgi:2-methylisocitrate lyase-like PEP mutase family enzyme
MSVANQLRQVLRDDEAHRVPGVHDPLTGRIIDATDRFDSLLMTGYGASLATIGLPDAGFATMTEVVRNAKYLQETVDLPVVADADNGYGNATNVIRTTRELVTAGVAGVIFEDQAAPKRCGNLAGKQIISREEAVGKVRAAVDTRDEHDEDFVVVGRTDARGAVDGTLDEAIARANAFADVGADATFVHGPESSEEARRIGTEVTGPSIYVCSGSVPYRELETFREWGFDMVVYPRLSMQATIVGLYTNAVKLADEGNDAAEALEGELEDLPIGTLDEFAGFPTVIEWEEKYLPEAELAKYE